MRTTIDAAGRVVIPKALREEAGLVGGTEVEIELYNGRIEIEPVPLAAHIVEKDGDVYIVADEDVPPLTNEDVRAVLDRVRR